MLKLYELPPSPNNTKVRMALRFKEIEFEPVEVPHDDRRAVLAASGQELTPVIEHDGVVLNDSEAILQYLDANFRDTPRLFPADRTGRRACDAFDEELQERLTQHWLPVFFKAIGVRRERDEQARGRFHEALDWLEGQLSERDGFSEGRGAICDLRVATWCTYALPGPALVERVPLFRRFRKFFAADSERLPQLGHFLEPWNERLG